MVSIGWYSTMPVVLGMSRSLNATYYADANARNIAIAVEYATYAWGPIFILFIILWALVSSSKKDVESQYYE